MPVTFIRRSAGPARGWTGGGPRASPGPGGVDRLLSAPQRVDVGAVGGERGPPPRDPRRRRRGRGPRRRRSGRPPPAGRVPPRRPPPGRGGEASRSGIRTSESMSPASRTPRSARRTAAWPMACASCSMSSPGTGPPSAGSGVSRRDQLEGDAGGALRRHRLRSLPGLARQSGRRRRWRSGARRRTGGARAGGPSGGGWRTRRPPGCRAGPRRRRARSARSRRCRGRPGPARVAAHHDGVAPDPLALPDPDAVGHLVQHRSTLAPNWSRHNRAEFRAVTGRAWTSSLVTVARTSACERPWSCGSVEPVERESALTSGECVMQCAASTASGCPSTSAPTFRVVAGTARECAPRTQVYPRRRRGSAPSPWWCGPSAPAEPTEPLPGALGGLRASGTASDAGARQGPDRVSAGPGLSHCLNTMRARRDSNP